MKIPIGAFAKGGVESDLGANSIDAGVRTALLRYAERLRSDRPPLSPPSFLGGRLPPPCRPLEMQVDGEMASLLENEARNHAVSVEQVALHAVLIELAEGDQTAIS